MGRNESVKFCAGGNRERNAIKACHTAKDAILLHFIPINSDLVLFLIICQVAKRKTEKTKYSNLRSTHV